MTWRFGDRDKDGITRHWRPDGQGGIQINISQDTQAVIDANKHDANFNDGYTPSRELRRAARIPQIVIMKWLIEEGLDVYDPGHADRLVKKLNDPDWRYLRTADGHLGFSNGVIR